MNRLYSILFLPAFFLLTACKNEAPEIEGIETIVAVANSVDEEKVFPWVWDLTELHLNDSPVNNTGFPPADLFPSGNLTRTKAVGFVASAFEDMGYNADTIIQGEEPLLAYNVFAEQKGTVYPDEVVLLAAHLDAFYGGADDNCSAIAAMLETARAIKKHTFARTIRFVAFDLEEFGSVGSTRYIEAGYAEDVKFAVVLDLLGYYDEKPGSQKSLPGIRLPDVGNFLFAIGNKNSALITQKIVSLANESGFSKTLGIVAPGDGTFFLSSVFMRSDHGLLWYQGVPAIFFTDGANFRNPNYHRPTDLPGSLNENFLIQNTKIITAAIAMLAEVQP